LVDSKVTGERVRVVVHLKVETQLVISLGIQVQVSMMNTEAWELPELDQVTKEAHLRFIRIIETLVKKTVTFLKISSKILILPKGK
jgi:IMP dehydrogenase/GMP reductase